MYIYNTNINQGMISITSSFFHCIREYLNTHGLLSGIIASLIAAWIIYLIHSAKMKRARFTGVWVEEIKNSNNKTIKRDYFYLKQKRDNITGKARRQYPPRENDKCYEANGIVINDDLIALFWATAPTLAKSYGCGIVHQKETNLFSGYYYNIKALENDEKPGVIVEMRKLSATKSAFNRYYKTGIISDSLKRDE